MSEEKKELSRGVIITENGIRKILRPVSNMMPKKNKNHKRIAPQVMGKAKPGWLKCQRSQCLRFFNQICSQQNGHAGFCRKKCFTKVMNAAIRQGVRPAEVVLSKPQKRQARQIRRYEKKTKDRSGFYWSEAWRNLRFKILRKYNFTCLACGRKPPSVIIHVDHIKPRSTHPGLELDPDNLQLLCEDCNLGKSNQSQDDLRPDRP